MIPHIDAHKKHVTATHPKMKKMRLLQEHNRTFISWFREIILADDNPSKTLRLLVVGPNLNVPTWKGYDINNLDEIDVINLSQHNVTCMLSREDERWLSHKRLGHVNLQHISKLSKIIFD